MKNWKTTLAGIGAAVCVAAQPTLDAIQSGGTNINWQAFGIAIALAVLGAMSKDHNVTGA